MTTYPTRCRIVDVTGEVGRFEPGVGEAKEFELVTPDASKPHIGLEGVAELLDELTVRITLDDGTIIYGNECWWDVLSAGEEKP